MQDEIHSSIAVIQLIPEVFPEYGSIQHPFAEAQLSDVQFVHPSAVIQPFVVEFEHLSVGVAHWP